MFNKVFLLFVAVTTAGVNAVVTPVPAANAGKCPSLLRCNQF
jgi:hypothetical protein